jgi:hypothetical protein
MFWNRFQESSGYEAKKMAVKASWLVQLHTPDFGLSDEMKTRYKFWKRSGERVGMRKCTLDARRKISGYQRGIFLHQFW